jgi:hypothetical protein
MDFFCKPLNNKSGSPVRAAALFFLYVYGLFIPISPAVHYHLAYGQ